MQPLPKILAFTAFIGEHRGVERIPLVPLTKGLNSSALNHICNYCAQI